MATGFDIRERGRAAGKRAAGGDGRKTILICSPDLNFCFSLSMFFQDRYNVITASDSGSLDTFGVNYSADLIIVDANPSEQLIGRLRELRKNHKLVPVIITYVCSGRELCLDKAIREEVDSVLYKPFEISTVSSRVEELLAT